MKSLVSFTAIACLWMIFALSSCGTQDNMAAKPAMGAPAPTRHMQMHIFFEETDNKVTLTKVKQTGGGGPPNVEKKTGTKTGSVLAESIVTYFKNPNCVSVNVGGSFYESCF
jgi:hypothetical protein